MERRNGVDIGAPTYYTRAMHYQSRPGAQMRAIGTALAFTTLFGISALALDWTSQGPAPSINAGDEGITSADGANPIAGAMNTFAAHPTDANTLYAAGVNGGIWKSTNAKNDPPTWTIVSEDLPSLSIGTLAMNPLDPSIIFAGAGATSSLAGTSGPLWGVARSTDAGATWTVVSQETASVAKVVITSAATKANQAVIYATALGVSRSTDGGATFTQVNSNVLANVQVSDLAADPGVANRVYAGGSGKVFKSEDAGATWTDVSGGTGFTAGATARILLSVHNSANADVVYAMVIDGGSLANVFRSADQGATWTALNVPAPAIFPGKQGGTQGAIVADKTDPNMVWVSGDRQPDTTEDGSTNPAGQFPNVLGATTYSGNLWRNNNGTWESVCANGANGSSPHADSRSLGFDADGNILHTCDGGIFRLVNPNGTTAADKSGTRKWTSVNGNMRVLESHNAVYDPVAKVFVCGAQDNGVNAQRKTSDSIWEEKTGGDGGRVEVDADQTAHPGQSIRYDSSQNFQGFQRRTFGTDNQQVGASEFVQLNITSGPGTGQTLTKFDKVLFLQPFVLNQIDGKRMLIGTEYIYESLDRGDTLANLGFASPQGTTNAKAMKLPRNPKMSDAMDNMHVDRDGNGVPSDFVDAIGDDTNSGSAAMVYGGRLQGNTFPDMFYTGANKTITHRVKMGDPLTTLNAYPGDKIRVLVVDPQNYKSIFVLDATGKIFMSGDEGATFTNITANIGTLTTDLRTIEMTNPDTSGTKAVLYAGGLGGVFKMPTPSANATWSADSNGLPKKVLVYDLRCELTSNTIIAGTLGRGVYSSSLSGATTGSVANISTRLPIGAGDDVLITGFIITGPTDATKKMLVRGIGPSLAANVTGALADPQLTLNDSTGTAIARNDNWKQTDVFGIITADQSADIQATGAQPKDDKEAALIATLKPGSYTAVVRGVGGTTGIGLADAYDLSIASGAQLANVSTRGFVRTGDNIMIGGFITVNAPVKVVVRAIGPSLAQFNVASPLMDPTLELRNGQGTLVASNDNWKVNDQTGQSQEADIRATQLQPTNDAESALVQTLQPGPYTAQVRGKGDTTGIGVVELYALP